MAMELDKSSLTISALIVIFLLEGVFPHYKGRSKRLTHAFPHLVTGGLNGLLTGLVFIGLTVAATGWTEVHSFGLLSLLPLSPVAGGIVSFILFDIWMYFWHMANHRISFFWRFHKAHHADTEMDTTTALRFHPGELVLSSLIRLPVIVIIGMSFSQIAMYEMILNVSILFHHSNVGIPERWDRVIRTFIVTPNMHRVHHSVEGFELNSNFTSTLSLWDRLFRTFRKRDDTLTITIGLRILRERKWQELLGFLITPFVKVQ